MHGNSLLNTFMQRITEEFENAGIIEHRTLFKDHWGRIYRMKTTPH